MAVAGCAAALCNAPTSPAAFRWRCQHVQFTFGAINGIYSLLPTQFTFRMLLSMHLPHLLSAHHPPRSLPLRNFALTCSCCCKRTLWRNYENIVLGSIARNWSHFRLCAVNRSRMPMPTSRIYRFQNALNRK